MAEDAPGHHVMTVGLTGGIGSGKTTVSDLFRALGAPVIDSDEIAHEMTAPGGRALDTVIRRFGSSVSKADGSLDRAALREIVFGDPDQRHVLESILHPLIRSEIDRRLAGIRFHYCIIAIPLLVETNQADRFDRVLVVQAPLEKRLEWIRERSELDEAEIRRIIDAQASDEARREVADDIIMNDRTAESLEQKVRSLHQKYMRTAIP